MTLLFHTLLSHLPTTIFYHTLTPSNTPFITPVFPHSLLKQVQSVQQEIQPSSSSSSPSSSTASRMIRSHHVRDPLMEEITRHSIKGKDITGTFSTKYQQQNHGLTRTLTPILTLTP